MKIIVYDAKYRQGLIDLWSVVFLNPSPWNDPTSSLTEKLRYQAELIFLGLEDERVIGAIMAGYDGHRGWIYSVATLPEARGRGIATELLLVAEQALAKLGCVKVNLQVVDHNKAVQELYSKNGYSVEPRISMGKRLGEFAE